MARSNESSTPASTIRGLAGIQSTPPEIDEVPPTNGLFSTTSGSRPSARAFRAATIPPTPDPTMTTSALCSVPIALLSGTAPSARPRLSRSVRAGESEDVLGDVGEDEFLADRGDAGEAGLAEVALDVVLGGVAEAAVRLDRPVGGEEARFGGEVLGQVGLFAAGQPGVDEAAGFPDHEGGGPELGVGLGQGEGDALVLSDRAVEDDPLVGVGDGGPEGGPADAERFGGDEDPFGVEPVEEVPEAAALLADPVRQGDHDIVIGRLARGDGVAAHLLDGDRPDAGGVAVDEEERHALMGPGDLIEGRGPGEKEDPVGFEGLGGPHLAAVDHVGVAMTVGPGGDLGGVGAG